jgi:hypothetical protein
LISIAGARDRVPQLGCAFIPTGTNIRNGIIGLIPVVGDIVTTALSL